MDFNNSKRVFLGLSTSCSRVSKKFPVVPQNVGQKLLFATEVAQTLLEKQNFPLSDVKIYKLYNKSKISKYFCAVFRRNQRK